MNLETALTHMRNLGVILNDDDSEALDTLCDFVESAINKAVNLPEPDRIMWQYGVEKHHYTEEQLVDYARLYAASISA